MKCKICDLNFKRLGNHIKKVHEIDSKKYYDRYLGKQKFCLNCGNPTKFNSIKYGYHEYCCKSCSGKSKISKQKSISTNIKKYGYRSHNQSNLVKEKKKQTCLENLGFENPSQSKEIKEKKKTTTVNSFGVENPFQSEQIKEKIKNSNFKKYGVENTGQIKEIREKIEKTNLINFGFKTPFKNKEIKEKIKQTNLKKYGVENPQQNIEIKEKTKQTCLEKYGYKTVLLNEKIKNKINISFKKNFFKNSLMKLNRTNNCIPLFLPEEYNGTDSYKKYKWYCVTCKNIFMGDIDTGKPPRCPVCFPILKGFSKMEKEVADFCKQHYPDLKENDRSLLKTQELDIYIPEIKLAIEFDGLYWHSELQGKDKNYHLNKTIKCEEKGVRLIHIFEDEWFNKQDIVKSILLSKMGKLPNKIYARKCEIYKIKNNIATKFFEENHIQGAMGSNMTFGLYDGLELVIAMSFGKSRFNKKFEWEILRFCSKLNTNVIGGMSRILKHFKKRYNVNSMLTYADTRYGTGSCYLNAGFTFFDHSQPSYFYFKKGILARYNRQSFQKHKLSKKLDSFDPNLTEWQNMQLNGWNRIWDCGNNIYHYSKDS